MLSEFRPALVMLLLMSALTGAAYPLLVTGVSQMLFPHSAQGSLLMVDGQPVGSALVGQPFSDPGYLWGRPSATAPYPYNASASGGSNQGPTSDALADAVRQRVAALRAADPGNTASVPVDLVTASASGLDPHISPAAARYQAARVAAARRIDPAVVEQVIARHTQGRLLGVLGEPRVSVLEVNLALDSLRPGR